MPYKRFSLTPQQWALRVSESSMADFYVEVSLFDAEDPGLARWRKLAKRLKLPSLNALSDEVTAIKGTLGRCLVRAMLSEHAFPDVQRVEWQQKLRWDLVLLILDRGEERVRRGLKGKTAKVLWPDNLSFEKVVASHKGKQVLSTPVGKVKSKLKNKISPVKRQLIIDELVQLQDAIALVGGPSQTEGKHGRDDPHSLSNPVKRSKNDSKPMTLVDRWLMDSKEMQDDADIDKAELPSSTAARSSPPVLKVGKPGVDFLTDEEARQFVKDFTVPSQGGTSTTEGKRGTDDDEEERFSDGSYRVLRQDGQGRYHNDDGPAGTVYHPNGTVRNHQYAIRGQHRRDIPGEPSYIGYYPDGSVWIERYEHPGLPEVVGDYLPGIGVRHTVNHIVDPNVVNPALDQWNDAARRGHEQIRQLAPLDDWKVNNLHLPTELADEVYDYYRVVPFPQRLKESATEGKHGRDEDEKEYRNIRHRTWANPTLPTIRYNADTDEYSTSAGGSAMTTTDSTQVAVAMDQWNNEATRLAKTHPRQWQNGGEYLPDDIARKIASEFASPSPFQTQTFARRKVEEDEEDDEISAQVQLVLDALDKLAPSVDMVHGAFQTLLYSLQHKAFPDGVPDRKEESESEEEDEEEEEQQQDSEDDDDDDPSEDDQTDSELV